LYVSAVVGILTVLSTLPSLWQKGLEYAWKPLYKWYHVKFELPLTFKADSVSCMEGWVEGMKMNFFIIDSVLVPHWNEVDYVLALMTVIAQVTGEDLLVFLLNANIQQQENNKPFSIGRSDAIKALRTVIGDIFKSQYLKKFGIY